MSTVHRSHPIPIPSPTLARASLFVFSVLVVAASLLACENAPAAVTKGEAGASEEPGVTSAAPHAHKTPGETCFICDASKRDAKRLWCKEHGRYEDRCWECHPELRDANREYCEEHGLYEDECFLCDPTRLGGKEAAGAATTASAKSDIYCNEHRVSEMDCGICQPERAAKLAVGDSLLVRLASERSADLAGLTISTPIRANSSTSLSLLGEINFDGNRLAKITPLASGVITKIRADVGRKVNAGEVLALVNAPDVAAAKAAYLSAQADLQMRQTALERQRLLLKEGVGSRSALEEAQALFERAQVAKKLARQGLLNLGFADSDIASMKDAGSSLPLRSPFTGTVVSRSAVLGEVVNTGDTLFEVADLRNVWVELSVPEGDAARIRIGTPLRTKAEALPGAAIDGEVTWVSPTVDERTRMVRARGVLPNTDGSMRRGMFADVTAIIDSAPDSTTLPASAIHRINELPFVFVRKEPDVFAARRVELGARLPSGAVVVRAGVGPDEAVVMSGGFVLKSALLASRLGAGCAED